jgi:hypothetical protein
MMNGLRTLCSRWNTWLTRSLSAALLVSLTACGGGGGGGGGFLPDDGSSDLLAYTLTLQVVDANGNPTTFVSETFPARLLVTVREDNFDAPVVAGVVAAASADFAVIAPSNGQALTNADGVAEFQLQAGTTLGADTIQVTVESPAGAITATVGVEIIAAGISLGFFEGTQFVPGEIGLSSDSLAFRGSAVARVAVVDETGATVTAPQPVRFSSACSLSGIAAFRTVGDASDGSATLTVDTVDGLVSVEYVAGACEDGDELRAELVNNDATATALVTIAGRDANFIGYVSSDPAEGEEGTDRTIIALKGTGGPGRPELATIIFEVLEESVILQAGDPTPGDPGYLELEGRKPLAGVTVNFGLTNTLAASRWSTTRRSPTARAWSRSRYCRATSRPRRW